MGPPPSTARFCRGSAWIAWAIAGSANLRHLGPRLPPAGGRGILRRPRWMPGGVRGGGSRVEPARRAVHGGV